MQAWRVEDGATPKSDVITLDVHFMNGPKSDQRKVERIASEWTDKALGERVRFRFGGPPARGACPRRSLCSVPRAARRRRLRRRRRVARRRDRGRAAAGAVVRRLHDRLGEHDRDRAGGAVGRLLARRAAGRPRPDARRPLPRRARAPPRCWRSCPFVAGPFLRVSRRGARPRSGRRVRRLAGRRARAGRRAGAAARHGRRRTRCA